MFGRLRKHPERMRAMRQAGQATARRFLWPEVVQRVLLPRLALANGNA